MSDYLIEIGVEELPANQVEFALEQFSDFLDKNLKDNQVSFNEIKKFATPRRLALIFKGLEVNSVEELSEVKGPSEGIAYKEDGKPSKALEGFMRSQGLNVDDLFTREIKGISYVYGKVRVKNKSLGEILQSETQKAIRSIVFPKSMRWGGKNLRFSRPIRWLLSLLDDRVLPLELEEIPVSNDTYGHRFLSKGKVTIFNTGEYEEKLEKAFVIADPKERKALIKSLVDKAAKEHGGNAQKDEALLDEINYLVEYPTALSGKIKEEYMSLPPEVIITPMKEHLRFFPVLDDDGKLLPYFISVRNGGEEFLEIVREGNEKVLDPRLEDARFFYDEDISKSLEDYVEDLKRVTFHEKLGSLHQRVERLIQISKKYAQYLSLGKEQMENIHRAAFLSKADLITNMVEEFTELQGTMGRIYAEKSGEDKVVSEAVFEQYLPRFSGDLLPKSTIGTVLSLADKFDIISGMFAVGIKPTGSSDPFGLRRAAIGILNILLDKNITLHLEDFIMDSLYAYVDINGLVFDYKEISAEIQAFFDGRFRTILSDEGISHSIIEAVIDLPSTYLDIRSRAMFLEEKSKSKIFSDVMSGYNRIKSMTDKAQSKDFDEKVFEEKDRILLSEFKSKETEISEALVRSDYEFVMENLASLEKPINDYMDNVMVLTENESLRNSRLALLKTIRESFDLLCDFSKVVG